MDFTDTNFYKILHMPIKGEYYDFSKTPNEIQETINKTALFYPNNTVIINQTNFKQYIKIKYYKPCGFIGFGLKHREEGPAEILLDEKFNTQSVTFVINGKLHREEGAAVIQFYNKKKFNKHFCLHNIHITKTAFELILKTIQNNTPVEQFKIELVDSRKIEVPELKKIMTIFTEYDKCQYIPAVEEAILIKKLSGSEFYD